jgi:hypothetical protein
MPLAEIDWNPTGIQEEQEDEIISSMFWDLKASSLDGWRPFSATLLASDLYGPYVGTGHGIDFRRHLMFGFTGPRGAAKTCSLSYVLAKILRVDQPVWTNYPISFFVQERETYSDNVSQQFIRVGQCHWINEDATISYYESMPLDMDKFYTFHTAIRNGAVGIDELPYFAEARTSGRYQNRILTYQIMQLRKTSDSFGYTAQNQKWVDNRFGWSADWLCECYDVSKKSYDRRALGHELQEGEVSRWTFKDISGVLTGAPFDVTERVIGPYQFDSKLLWNIYPTHFVIDVFEAMKGPERDKDKKDASAELTRTVELIANQYLESGGSRVPARELLDAVNSKLSKPAASLTIGRILSSMGIRRTGGHNKPFYDFEEVIQELRENERAEA